jgi:hypothetical protein
VYAGKVNEYKEQSAMWLRIARRLAFGLKAAKEFEAKVTLFKQYLAAVKDPKERGRLNLRAGVRGIYEYKEKVVLKRGKRRLTRVVTVTAEDPLLARTPGSDSGIPAGAYAMFCKEPKAHGELYPNRHLFQRFLMQEPLSLISHSVKAFCVRASRMAEMGCELDVKKPARRRTRRKLRTRRGKSRPAKKVRQGPISDKPQRIIICDGCRKCQ